MVRIQRLIKIEYFLYPISPQGTNWVFAIVLYTLPIQWEREREKTLFKLIYTLTFSVNIEPEYIKFWCFFFTHQRKKHARIWWPKQFYNSSEIIRCVKIYKYTKRTHHFSSESSTFTKKEEEEEDGKRKKPPRHNPNAYFIRWKNFLL